MSSCPQCGGGMPANAPLNLCPKCLIGAALVVDEPIPEMFPETPQYIGRYKVLEKLGEGGCGVVYLAQQEEPIRRRVAVKLIKPGMDTKQVIARFEAERQTLALMHHSNIAKVLDAGASESGHSYFVMELVRGVKITEYCDRYYLSTRERLDLFMQVCHAIQHAHRKGIIHRDIKPSNVLVTQQDGKPVPMVIDFGIAKATCGQVLTNKTLFTNAEQFVGTPAYMSPEQVERRRDIDTGTDVYSLGVLLYELLTGNTPFNSAEIHDGWDSIRRKICETEPQTPSTRLTALAPMELNRIAKCRRAAAPKLIEVVRGDLDWIVMKCLEKETARRYETCNAIAQDIERHLNQEPIEARPASNFYRFQKLVRRNRLVVGAVGGVIAALMMGTLVSTWFYAKERQAFKKAQKAEQDALEREQDALEREQDALERETRAQRKLDYLHDVHVDRLYPPNSPRKENRTPVMTQAVSLPLLMSGAMEGESEDVPGWQGMGTFAGGSSGVAGEVSPVVPPGDKKWYKELATVWWKWFLELPWFDEATGAYHPAINDTFDENQGKGFLPPYQFLAAPFGTTIRECEVSTGTYVFMALLNAESSSLEDYPFYGETHDEQAAVAKDFADHIDLIYLEIDGVAIDNVMSHRVESQQIAFNAPSPWIYGERGGYGTSTGDGYYLLLRPLPPGEHTIYYFGGFRFQEPEDPFTDYLFIEMTYKVIVR